MANPRRSSEPDSTRSDKDTSADLIDPRAFGLAKAAYAVGETLDLLSIGRTSLYAAIKRGDLKCVKFGKKTLFYAADLASFLTRLRRMSEAKADRVGRTLSSSKGFERS
jgi:excisionase family DNA binding protein